MARPDDEDPARGASPSERILVFRLERRLHAIRVSEIGGVVGTASIRALPGAPACVMGLSEWRGSVLTVLDLARFLGVAPEEDPACLIRLAPPLDHTALFLPATVQLTERRLERRGDPSTGEPDWWCAEEPVTLVEPLEIVRRVETEMRESC